MVASIDDDASLLAAGGTGYVILLALGTLLMGLAAWTFLLDRRMLERRATTDELTGLVNRREFELDSEVAARRRSVRNRRVRDADRPNGFKQINDTLGHQFGDVALKAAADRLRSAVRDTDVVGRWGGDEFVILLAGGRDGAGVRASAERIGHSLAAHSDRRQPPCTRRSGQHCSRCHGRELDDLISAADVAMYSAKTTGVIYRLADVHAVDLAAEAVRSESGYEGPNRRRRSSDSELIGR